MSEQDWNAEAEAMARYVADNLAGQPRGAIPGRQTRVAVLFGNEGRQDPAAVQDEIARIRDMLDEEGIRVLGFALAPGDRETWAMIVECEDLGRLEELVSEPADGFCPGSIESNPDHRELTR
jgi:hypothetical protein